MIEIGDLLTLSNNKEYIVLKQISFDDKIYLYLISKDGISNILIGCVNKQQLTIVKNEEQLQVLFQKFREIRN